MRLFLMLILVGSAFAVPRFALMEDVSCGSCHSYQGGGGARNSYGQEYVSESLVLKDIKLPWVREESEFPLYFGADMRYQAVSADELKHFPMQFTLYSGAELGGLISHVEVSRILEEFRVTGGIRYEGLPMDAWVFLGKELPAPGWRLDDHTTFIRGGNLTYLGLSYEGMPYTPYIEAPLQAEVGFISPFGMEVSISSGTPILDPNALNSASFLMMKLDQSLYLGSLLAKAGTAYLVEGEISSLTAFYGVGVDRFVYLGEYVEMHNWPVSEMVSVASMNQFSYRLTSGVDMLFRYEFFDPDRKLSNGAITRLTGGVEFFPIPGIEVKLSYRQDSVELPEQPKLNQGKLLAQLHLYF